MSTRLYLVGHRHDPHAGSSRTNQVFPFIVVGRSGSQAIPIFQDVNFYRPLTTASHFGLMFRRLAPLRSIQSSDTFGPRDGRGAVGGDETGPWC